MRLSKVTGFRVTHARQVGREGRGVSGPSVTKTTEIPKSVLKRAHGRVNLNLTYSIKEKLHTK